VVKWSGHSSTFVCLRSEKQGTCTDYRFSNMLKYGHLEQQKGNESIVLSCIIGKKINICERRTEMAEFEWLLFCIACFECSGFADISVSDQSLVISV